MPDATRDGRVLVGKNSDRPVGEAQPLRFFPRCRSNGTPRRLTYVEIDDVGDSHAHIGASPYWCRGHEFGLNEWGVAVGNEALFTRDWAGAISGAKPPYGILGMELVRLGLERGRTAEEALAVICGFLERFGQWGSAVPGRRIEDGAYDNSFLIADAETAWVLETSGRTWAASQVRSGTRSISNEFTIRTEWDRASADLVEHAVSAGWWPSDGARPFDVARAYTDVGTPLQVSHLRLQRSRSLLGEARADGGVDVEAARRILRDHYEGSFLGGPNFNAALPDFLTLCMHAHPAGFTWGNTAGSAIFVLPRNEDELPYLWWTPVTPCTGLYIPVFVGELPESLTLAGSAGNQPRRAEDASPDSYSDESYWWHFQRLLDSCAGGVDGWAFTERQAAVRARFDPLERQFTERLPEVQREAVRLRRSGRAGDAAAVLSAFTADCAGAALHAADGCCFGT